MNKRGALLPLALAVLLTTALRGQTTGHPTVLQDVRLIDGTGAPPRDHMQVTIDGTKIVEIRSALLRIAFPPNATIVNLTGKTVMPGLINAHGHLGLVKGTSVSPDNYTAENIQHQLEQYERYGVTTVMSLGMNKDLVYELKARQARGELDGATILDADRGIGSPGGMPPMKVGPDQLYRPGSEEEARRDVDEMAARRPELIKIWVDDNLGKLPKMQPEIYRAAIEQAHKHSLRIAAHVYYEADARQLVEDGVDILAHSIRDKAISPETVQLIKDKRIFYVPTLQLEESFYGYAEHPEWLREPFFAGALSPELKQMLNSEAYRSGVAADKNTPVHKQALRTAMGNLKTLADAGVNISFGTDSGANPYRIQGWAEHRELQLMVEAGLTPLQAIHCATQGAAQMLHIEETTGTVAKGKSADLLVLDADPSTDIRNSQKIHMVFHRGRKVAQ